MIDSLFHKNSREILAEAAIGARSLDKDANKDPYKVDLDKSDTYTPNERMKVETLKNHQHILLGHIHKEEHPTEFYMWKNC